MPTIGEQFKAAREAKGISQHDAGIATNIMTKIIVAMEADDFSAMPAPTYAKGFIRLYAKYLELNPEPLIEEYSQKNKAAPRPFLDSKSQLNRSTNIVTKSNELPQIKAPDWLKKLGGMKPRSKGIQSESPPARRHLFDENSQLGRNTNSRSKSGAARISPPDWLSQLHFLKKIPLGPFKDVRIAAGAIAGLLALAALIGLISNCAGNKQAVETTTPTQEKPAPEVAPAPMLLDEPLPDLYLTGPNKIETN
jgi:hypothetical protein